MRIKPEDIKQAVVRMGMLRYFPADAETRAEIAALLARMCPHREALEWLVRQLVDGVGEWQGPADLRRILVSRWPPADQDEGDGPLALNPPEVEWSRFPLREEQRALPPRSRRMIE